MAVAFEVPERLAGLPRKSWTVEECLLLEGMGLPEFEQYELIEGELVEKVSKRGLHVGVLAVLAEWMRDAFGRFRFLCESPIQLEPGNQARSLPEPDAVALTHSLRGAHRLPKPEEVLLVVEVSATSIDLDLSVKARLYARHAIPEYWVVDLKGRRIIVHRDPEGDRYRSVLAFGAEESVTPQAAPGHPLRVGELFE